MKSRKRNSLQITRVLSLFGFCLFSFGVYLFSADSQILSIRVNGNQFYSSQEIYKLAGLSGSSRILFHPESRIESLLEDDPMIEAAQVVYDGNTLSITVEEKLLIGYYMEEDQPVALAINGETIPVDESHRSVLRYLPLMAGFSNTQMQNIAAAFNRYETLFDASVFDKIAEMVPWEESYDDSMIKMTMQDGNVVISSISDLVMISKYQALLSKLEGTDVCLFLDAQNSAIDKISCSYIYMSAEEREEQRKALKEELERLAKEAEAEARRREEEAEQERLAQEQAEQEAQQEQDYIWEAPVQESEEGTLDLNDDWQTYYETLINPQNDASSGFGGYDWNASDLYGTQES